MNSLFGALFGSARQIFLGENRARISVGPSSATPELKQAWENPLVRFTPTTQPYTSPLTMYGGNALLNGETAEMRREYREWSFREPPVKAALLTKCFAVASLDPQLKAENDKDQQDKKAAAWVDWAVRHAVGGWPGLIQSLTLPALIDGFSVNEKCWDTVETVGKEYSGWWTVKRFSMIDTEHIRFKLDPYRQVIGVRPYLGVGGFLELNPEDFIIFTHLKMFENPFGISDLRAVVRDCRLLEAAIKLRHLLLTNWSGPFLKGSHRDDTTRRQLMDILSKARANGYIVVPDGTELEVINLATSAPGVFDAAIAAYRENIVTAIQGAYLQLLEGHTQDGRGNSVVHMGAAELFVWWLAAWVCEVINVQLIPQLVRPNFGNSVGLPTLTLGGISEAQVSAALDRFKRGQELGIQLSKEQVCSVGGFEAPRDASDILQPPQNSPTWANGQQDGQDPFGGSFGQKGGIPAVAGTFPG